MGSVRFITLLGATTLLSACGWVQWPPQNGAFAMKQRPASSAQSTQVASAAPGSVMVVRGDTVYGLSKRHNVSSREIIEANRLAPPYYLYVGQRLAIPGAGGSAIPAVMTTNPAPAPAPMPAPSVVVAEAPLRGPSIEATPLPMPSGPTVVTAPPPMPMAEPLAAAPILIPSASETMAAPHASGAVPAQVPEATPVAAAPSPALQSPPPEVAKTAVLIPEPLPRTGGFAWPISGKILSPYGTKGDGLQNDGINIEAPRGSPIRAAENGVVAYAGNEIRGFGNMLLIKHEGGWVTAYAHADELLVKRGDRIKKGDVIAKVGATGNVDRPQLHFEMRQGKKAVDPQRYLKSGTV